MSVWPSPLLLSIFLVPRKVLHMLIGDVTGELCIGVVRPPNLG